jgi:hypothetical protein
MAATFADSVMRRPLLLIGSIALALAMAAGSIAAQPNKDILLINRTGSAPDNVRLPLSASRNGVAIVVKDIAGNASKLPTRVLFSGGETCDKLSEVPINSDYGAYTFSPLASGGWTILP